MNICTKRHCRFYWTSDRFLISESTILPFHITEKKIEHKHYVDFLIDESIIVECKAVEKLCIEHRQQLWNYMRLTGKKIGILYNFGPIKGHSEHYYLDKDGTMYMF